MQRTKKTLNVKIQSQKGVAKLVLGNKIKQKKKAESDQKKGRSAALKETNARMTEKISLLASLTFALENRIGPSELFSK